MARIAVENLSFCYPQAKDEALKDVSLDIESGSYVAVCGKSASGKSTLLHHLKTVLRPHGKRSGRVLIGGVELDELSVGEQAARIGFVLQNPDAQIVTDKTWHELAFGLENLGLDAQSMRTRVAEMASYFGMQSWFDADVNTLSGGQKQLLNLASVMAMQPEVLVLDEPTAQLDPIAAIDFLNTVSRINRDLGVTVVISEHRLEEVLPQADILVVMDEGRVVAQGGPREAGMKLFSECSDMRFAMPTPMRVYGELAASGDARVRFDDHECPMTVREGRNWLSTLACEGKRTVVHVVDEPFSPCGEVLLEARGLWYRYGRHLPDVLKGASLSVRSGEILAVVGGNGSGKSSLLRLLAGLAAPYRGSVSFGSARRSKPADLRANVALLPQDPQNLFSRSTALAELEEMVGVASVQDGSAVRAVAEQMEIAHLLHAHPYDLSGGEQQRLALAKLLLLKPRVLLLDEPSKGLDAPFKRKLGAQLRSLAEQGMAVVLVSHDLEFCASYADETAMFFDGAVTSVAPSRKLFSGNSFYTTAANRMSRSLVAGLVTDEDVIDYVR